MLASNRFKGLEFRLWGIEPRLQWVVEHRFPIALGRKGAGVKAPQMAEHLPLSVSPTHMCVRESPCALARALAAWVFPRVCVCA